MKINTLTGFGIILALIGVIVAFFFVGFYTVPPIGALPGGYTISDSTLQGAFPPSSAQTASFEPPLISTSDFEILSTSSRWEYGRLIVVGEVQNLGRVPAGVKLEAIARDENGTLLDSEEFWPASIRNIEPGETTGIEISLTKNTNVAKYEVRVIDVTQWD